MHDIVRCLLVLNAVVRENCKTDVTIGNNGPLHYAMWDIIDELVDTYNQYAAPITGTPSIFAMAQKDGTRQTAEELQKVLPKLITRLQRYVAGAALLASACRACRARLSLCSRAVP